VNLVDLKQLDELDVGKEATVGEDVEDNLDLVLAVKHHLVLQEEQNVPCT
jgi:hypothetical protein